MIIIRLFRRGRRNRPFYNVVVAHSRIKRDGKFIEKVGYYDPIRGSFSVSNERVRVWIKRGAGATQAVLRILKAQRQKEGLQFKESYLKE